MMTEPGTSITSDVMPRPQRSFWRFAAILKPPIAASWRSARSSPKRAIPSQVSRLSSATRTTGCKNTEVPRMEPTVARGYLITLLGSAQLRALHKREQELPPGRSLTASEIVRMFRVETGGLVTDLRTDVITDLWNQFEKTLWKNRQIENNLHDTICAGTPPGKWCRCKTPQQELADWDEYVKANYRAPVEVGTWNE